MADYHRELKPDSDSVTYPSLSLSTLCYILYTGLNITLSQETLGLQGQKEIQYTHTGMERSHTRKFKSQLKIGKLGM